MSIDAAIQGPDSIERVRHVVRDATVLACLPYLFLKSAWIVGWGVGAADDGFLDTSRGANILTMALEIVAITVAVAFAAPWGRRLPAFLVVFPAWVATGLLVPVAVGVLLGAPLQLITGGANPFTGDEVLAGWVFGLVYGGFAVQAVLLPVGFALHVRDRWPSVVAATWAVPRDAGWMGPLRRLLGGLFATAAILFALQQLWWAAWGGGVSPDPTTTQRVFLVTGSILAAGGAVAAVGLARGAPLTRSRLVLAWLGTAVTFTSTFVQTLTHVTLASGDWGATTSGPGSRSLTLLILLCALGGAIGGALRLVEEQAIGAQRRGKHDPDRSPYPCDS